MLGRLAKGCAEHLQTLRTLRGVPGSSWPAAARGLTTPSASERPPASGTETHFNREPLNFDNAPPGPALSAVPALPRFLGLAGAIPFIALSPPIAAALPLLPADLVANAGMLQVGYGASILSFLGGIHWAMAMAEYGGPAQSAAAATERYLWSVTPCLMAWPAVSLEPGPASLVIAGTLGIAYGVDRAFASKGLLPPWYMTLRLPLTLAAVIGMSLTLVASVREAEAAVPNQAPAPLPADGPKEMQLAAQPRGGG
ncbi:hypothetical protein WJX81_003874 [Elliptochloris bilobata]|uniref:DUF3429 domain-containing protein n=1 Tax=Elliptochloris bilobata TaxID=381761 RepID=A0AAW1RTJ5_9CHLO